MNLETKFEFGQRVYRIEWNQAERVWQEVNDFHQGGIITGYFIHTCDCKELHKFYEFGRKHYTSEDDIFITREEALAEIERRNKYAHERYAS